MSKPLIATTLVLALATGWVLRAPAPAPPPVGALQNAPALQGQEPDRLVPQPNPKPTLELGDKNKLFMGEAAYLFSTQDLPQSAALAPSATQSLRLGFGRELHRESGDKLTGEISFVADEQLFAGSDLDMPQTILSAAYLKQLGERSDFRAGLSTDIASSQGWSTLELQLSLQLSEDLSLRFRHDYGTYLEGPEREHQTGVALEKHF